jgi:exonuclease III
VVDSSAVRGGRRIFNLTAARWPLAELPPIGAPQPERVLGAICESPAVEFEIFNAHIPPAPSNGLAKIETCEALYYALARSGTRERILCGDLNIPRYETDAGEVETFASNHPAWEERWDAAERSLLVGLAEWDLRDVFRTLNGWERRDVSWVLHSRARRKAGHRLDHILASAGLNPTSCDYHHEWREAGLSDHSGMAARFEPVD